MRIIHKNTYTVHFFNGEPDKTSLNIVEAQRVAEEYVGNNVYAKIPGENTFLYGPGNGETTVMVREEIEFDMETT